MHFKNEKKNTINPFLLHCESIWITIQNPIIHLEQQQNHRSPTNGLFP